MKIPFTNLEIKSNRPKNTIVNIDKIEAVYEQMTRFFAKGQLIYNKNDFKRIVKEGYLFNPDVYSIINKKIQTASMIDFQLFEIKDEKIFRKYKNYRKNNMMEQIGYYGVKSLEPVVNNDLMKLLSYPNENQTATTFTQSLLGYYCLLGNSYLNKINIEGSKGNIPGKLQVLPAHLVKVIFGGQGNIIQGYTIDNLNDIKYNFEKENVYHFKTFNPDTDNGQFMYGAPPTLEAILTKSNDSYIAATELIRNMGAMGILSTGNDDTINADTTQAMEDRYSERFGGATKRGKVWIVGRKMEYQNIAQSITDLNLIQGQEQDFLTLCRVFNVDSRIMGYVKGSTFSNMFEARKDFLQNTILPLKYMESEAYNTFILPSFSARDNKKYYLDIDITAIPELQTDNDKLSQRIQKEISCGLLTPEEGARMLNYPELKEEAAKKLYIATNLTPLTKETPII